jgi:hypothetical protein
MSLLNIRRMLIVCCNVVLHSSEFQECSFNNVNEFNFTVSLKMAENMGVRNAGKVRM